ncbi:MAG: pyrroloquinoline quinone biosynthesis peptide chaperone PqqD [Bryobacteraceae bacterium]|jgi:pyrroloquinoline quinone biosynthesis protein D
MTEPATTHVPRLAAGCRMTQSADLGPVLLLPESMLRLTGPGPRILELCDGTRTLADVIAALQSEFSAADPAMIQREVLAFVASLNERRALDFT